MVCGHGSHFSHASSHYAKKFYEGNLWTFLRTSEYWRITLKEDIVKQKIKESIFGFFLLISRLEWSQYKVSCVNPCNSCKILLVRYSLVALETFSSRFGFVAVPWLFFLQIIQMSYPPPFKRVFKLTVQDMKYKDYQIFYKSFWQYKNSDKEPVD